MDRIKEMIDRLPELSEEEVSELQALIISEFKSVEGQDPTPQTVDDMTSLADMLDGVRNETKRREAANQELAQRATDAATRVHGEDASTDALGNKSETDSTDAPMDPPVDPAADADAPVSTDPSAPVDPSVDPALDAPVPTDAPVVPTDPTTPDATDPVAAPVDGDPVDADGNPIEDTTETPAEEDDENKKAKADPSQASTAVEKSAELSTTEINVAPDATPAPDAATTAVDGAATQELSTTDPKDQENMEAPVTAAGDSAVEDVVVDVPSSHRPVIQVVETAPVAITAGADIPGYTAGSKMDSMKAVSEAMEKRLHSLRRVSGGDGEQHIVASISTTFPESRVLGTNAQENWDKIQAVAGPAAITAAGGHSAPYAISYDIFAMGVTDRPVRDALPVFQADRGGIRFVTPPSLAGEANAVGIWTNVTDITPGTAVKASLIVSAATEVTVATDAVTLQLQFGNLMTRAYPELIARHNELGLIQHARKGDAQLLTAIGASSTAVTTTDLLGFGRDFLVQVGRAAASYRSRHRLATDAPLRVIIPGWVKDAMAADLALSAPGDNALNAYAEINAFIEARGVNLTVTLDGDVYGTQSAGVLLGFPNTFNWYIFAEGTFLMLDGGTLDLGIIRDSSLVGTNDYKMFLESFETAAFVGIESLKITSTINVNGAAAALRDTLGGVVASVIEF